MTDFNENFDEWMEEALEHVHNHQNFGGEVEEVSNEDIDEWFRQLGLDVECTEAVTLVGNTRHWSQSPHDWDQTLPHFWTDDELWECDPFYEEWLRYDPREGF